MTPSAEALREAKQICRCNCDRPHGFHREYCRTGTAEAVAAALSRVMAERDAARMAARFADDKYAAMMDELNDRDEAAIAAAVREERERCAGVARGWAGFKPEDASRPKSVMMAKLANLIANQIAAAIEGEDDEAE